MNDMVGKGEIWNEMFVLILKSLWRMYVLGWVVEKPYGKSEMV